MALSNGLILPGASPVQQIAQQMEPQLSSMLGTRAKVILIVTANEHLDMASGMSVERTIAILEAVLDDLKKPQPGLLVSGR